MLYFDYGAGMPIEKEAFDAMVPYYFEHYGNPSSTHECGTPAKDALQAARDEVARFVGAGEKDKIVFTSGATESNNLAIKGVARRQKRNGMHIVTTNIEHWAVNTPLKALEKDGYLVTRVPVESSGIVDAGAVRDAITDETTLVTIMTANNEVGTIQPIGEIARLAHEASCTVHTDATAAVGRIPVDASCGADLITLSSNDIYGPKGVGALYIRDGVGIEPVMHGGGQEFGLRSGTENVPGIVGMGVAARITRERMGQDMAHMRALQDRLIDGITAAVPAVHLNGDRERRLPNNVNLRFEYIEGESILLSLSVYDVAASTGSACSSKTLAPSHVLSSMGQDNEAAHGSLQINIGRYSTAGEVDFLIGKLPAIVKRLRELSMLTPKEMLKGQED